MKSRKVLSFVICVLLLVNLFPSGIAFASAPFAGAGTIDDPYLIGTASEWIELNRSTYLGANTKPAKEVHIKITNDIDLSNSTWTLLGLSGSLDGQGHTLTGLRQPLVGDLENVEVRNVILENVNITTNDDVGALARTNNYYNRINTTLIENCSVTGNFTISNTYYKGVGALIGSVAGTTTIRNCIANVTLSNTANGAHFGGLLGNANGTVVIENSVACGIINKELKSIKAAGGICGSIEADAVVSINNCVALQSEINTKNSNSGTIVGSTNGVAVSSTGNYAYSDMTGIKDSTSVYNATATVTKEESMSAAFWSSLFSGNTSWTANEGSLPTLNTTQGAAMTTMKAPLYLAATHTVSGTVTNTDGAVSGATITFTNAIGEAVLVTSDSSGLFSVQLPKDTFNVSITADGCLNFTDSIVVTGDTAAADFTIEKNPVSLGDDRTVSLTFISTDADSKESSDNISLIFDGTPNAEDFAISTTTPTYTPFTDIKISEVTDSALTISFAKRVYLGTGNTRVVYLFYKGTYVGKITLAKTINKVTLAVPTTARWDGGKAVWSAVANATGYVVQLYKDGIAFGNAVNTSDAFYDFTSVIAESGAYSFSVQATGNANIYIDSDTVTSSIYNFTEQTLDDVKTAALSAIANIIPTNDITADDLLSAVAGVITNQSITAEWSQADGFALTPATDGENTGVNGSITGVIVLTRGMDSLNIELNLEIMPKFKVEYNSGDYSPDKGSAPVCENKFAGDVIILETNPYVVYEYNFVGWSDGTNIYNAGDEYTVPRHNTVLSAVWIKDEWNGTTIKEPKKDSDGYYMITTGAELAYFCEKSVYDNIKLMCDIDMGNCTFKSIERFNGILDGQGFAIKNLNIEPTGVVYAGFIATMSNGHVKNLTIDNATLKDTSTFDSDELGIIAGRMIKSSKIENCYVSGTIDGNGKKTPYAGGIVGYISSTSAGAAIDGCYADVDIINFAHSDINGERLIAGGIAGGVDLTATYITISNCYSTGTIADAYIYSGILGYSRSKDLVIDKCYAAGKTLNTYYLGYGIKGGYGTVKNSISIFSEIENCKARISDISEGYSVAENNYSFFGTNAIDANGIIVDIDEAGKVLDGIHGADAKLADVNSQAFYADTLGWDFENTWKMPDAGSEYSFPVLQKQRASSLPQTKIDMTPLVNSITLDKTAATLYRGEQLQLNIYADVLNGASKKADWSSSYNKISVDADGLVTVADDAMAGEYIILATSKGNPLAKATCTITVDTAYHKLSASIQRGPYGVTPNVKFYTSYTNAENDVDEVLVAQAGSTVFAVISPIRDDELLTLNVNGHYLQTPYNVLKSNSTCTYIYKFIMPCADASLEGYAAHNVATDSYVWIVVTSLSSVGETTAFTIDEWDDGVGFVRVDKIINGKKFVKFDVRSASLAESGKIELTENTEATSIDELGDKEYCTVYENGMPKLLLNLHGPGSVTVEIVVEDDEHAIFNIEQSNGDEYYTLNTHGARAGDIVTATLTQAGVDRLKMMDGGKALLNYGGGLLVVIFPPEFTLQNDGTYKASFVMPAQDVRTNIAFTAQTALTLSGYDVTVDYNALPQSIDRHITAMAGTQDVSNLLYGRYDVTYTGIDGTAYSSTSTPPTNTGTYECVVRVSQNDGLYKSDDVVTVKMTIAKSTPAAPYGPKAIIRSANEIALTPPVAFADGAEIPAGYSIEYKCNDGEWTEDTSFTNLSQNTTYNFYARIKASDNNESSMSSEPVSITTPYGTPSADYVAIDYVNELIFFDSYLEINTTSEFDGSYIESGSSVTPYIGTTVYMRVKALGTSDSLEIVPVVIPRRPASPTITVISVNDNTVTLLPDADSEYKTADGAWQDSNIFEVLDPATVYTLYQRIKATDTSFASQAVQKDVTTSAIDSDMSIILTETSVSVNNVNSEGLLILASYYDDRLVKLSTVPVSSDAIHNIRDLITITTQNEVRAMVWDRLDSMKPLCPAKSILINK